jgi:hypothetical protein
MLATLQYSGRGGRVIANVCASDGWFWSSSKVHQGQVISCLQTVRTLVSEALHHELHLQRAWPEILVSLQWVTEGAAKAGFAGFVPICRIVSGRLNAIPRRDIKAPLLAHVGDWAAVSELYIRRPKFRQFSAMVVGQLEGPLWGIQIDDIERLRLINQLSENAADLVPARIYGVL